MSTPDCHLRVLRLRYELTSYLKPLTTYSQYVHYHTRATGYLNISRLLIYIKGIKDTEKKLCENDAKKRKKYKIF